MDRSTTPSRPARPWSWSWLLLGAALATLTIVVSAPGAGVAAALLLVLVALRWLSVYRSGATPRAQALDAWLRRRRPLAFGLCLFGVLGMVATWRLSGTRDGGGPGSFWWRAMQASPCLVALTVLPAWRWLCQRLRGRATDAPVHLPMRAWQVAALCLLALSVYVALFWWPPMPVGAARNAVAMVQIGALLTTLLTAPTALRLVGWLLKRQGG